MLRRLLRHTQGATKRIIRIRLAPGLRALGRRRTRWALAGALPALLSITVGGWWFLPSRGGPAPSHEAPTGLATVGLPIPPAPRPDHVVDFSAGCITAECHASLASTLPRTRLVHQPVAQHACDECHAPDSGGHTFPLLRSGNSLCSHCHPPSQTGGHALFQHRAIIDKGCTACHDPHASEGRSLLLEPTVEKTCARCHPASPGEHRHWPYATGECTACHQPHGSDTHAMLRAGNIAGPGRAERVESHCNLCHDQTVDAMALAAHSHRDTEHSCLTCHGAHATDWRRLQRMEPRLGCTNCHDDVARTVAGARVSHDAVLIGNQCASCHEPHASANAMMLRDDHGPVCLSCHSQPVMASEQAGGRLIPEMATAITGKLLTHGVVAAGNCAACHSVHGGEHARLLKEGNPTVLIGGFDLGNYALCFSCHDPNLALATSGDATAFRHGDVNLHRAHLRAGEAGERSRSCAACHAVHSSDHPRLIAGTVAYDGSTWMMPMGFFLTPDGGGCSPGCHEPLQYSRSMRNASPANNERDAR